MSLYRIKLRLRGPFLTPLQSDTLSGSLCWELRRSEGEAALKELLDRCRQGDPPFVLSDGFPDDLLPAPLSVYRLCTRANGNEEERFDLAREWKKRNLVPLATFESLRNGRLPELPEAAGNPFVTATRLHASLDRRSNRTLDPGGLREEEETYLAAEFDELSVYASMDDDWAERMAGIWQSLSRSGFGKKKSVGKGAFDYKGMEVFKGFGELAVANGFVSLSHFVPAADDPVHGDYAVLVKHGKLGEEFALSDHPFKRPLVLFTPGSCFTASGAPKQWYGRAVDGLVPEHPEILQLCFCLALPLRFPEDH